MSRVPLTGGSYQAYSVIASAQRSLNLFAEPMPQAQGEPAPMAHYPTPGLLNTLTLGEGPIRGIWLVPDYIFYVVSGSDVWRCEYTGGPPLAPTFSTMILGGITPGLTTPVSMADNGLALVIVDGHYDPTFIDPTAWTIDLATDAFSVIPNGGLFPGADKVDYLDGYFIFNQPFSQTFWISQFMLPSFDPLGLDFAAKITHSDLLITLIVSKRLVYLFGDRMTEIWYNAGATDIGAGSFPFAEMQSEVIIDHGVMSKYTPAVYDNRVYWLAKGRAGHPIVMEATGYQTKRVSTYAIENHFSEIEQTDAIGFVVQYLGHAMYVLTFPTADETWAYDITTGHWHEWLWVDDDGNEHRHRAMSYCSVGGIPTVGDWENGKLYALHGYTDDGRPIKRVRSFPHLIQDSRRTFYREFIADLETGNEPEGGVGAELVLLDASFTAPDDTTLDTYVSDVGGGWTLISGTGAKIESDALVGDGGGSTVYQSALTLSTADYHIRFDAVPAAGGIVGAGVSLSVIGRATGAGNGYRATVSADGTQYTLTLDVVGGTATASVVMGTIASGRYMVWLEMQGTTIAVQAQRTTDNNWLASDGSWNVSAGNIALQFTDSTYAAHGAVMIGGTWPTALRVSPPATISQLATSDWEIAELNVPTGDGITVGRPYVVPDYSRELIYFSYGGGGLRSYHYALTTQSPILSGTVSSGGGSTNVYGADVDAVTGSLIMQIGRGLNSASVFKVDPGTFTVTASYGSNSTSFPSYPASIWAGEQVVCCRCGTLGSTAGHVLGWVGYAVIKESGSGVAVYRVSDTLTHAGYYQSLVTGGSSHSAIMCGASGAIGAAAFLTWSPGSFAPSIPLYKVSILPGAETYNPASWPTPNPYITSTTLGTLAASDVDPTWTAIRCLSIGYDNRADTNQGVLMLVQTNTTGVSVTQYLVKLHTNSTAVRWVSPFPTAALPALAAYLISGGTPGFLYGTVYDTFDMDTGALTSEPVSGLTYSSGFDAGDIGFRTHIWNAVSGLFFLEGGYIEGAGSPTPVSGTPSDFSGFAIMGPTGGPPPDIGDGMISLAMDNVVCATGATPAMVEATSICLDWSNDRGHTFGNPVCQPFGDFLTSLQWQRLGMARDRVFRLTWYTPVHTALQGAWVTAITGDEDNEMAGQGR